MVLNNLGNIMEKRGDLRGAIRQHEQTLAVYREIGDKSGLVESLLTIGGELQNRAELSRAHRSMDEALRISRQIDGKVTTVVALTKLASVLADEGNLTASTKLCEEAMSISRSMGAATAREAAISLTLARLAAEKGEVIDAETFARSALEHYLKGPTPGAQAAAYDTLARSYLAAAKFPEARDAVDSALTMPNLSVSTRLSIATTFARTLESRSPGDAIRQLRSTIDEATKTGYLRLAFEARLPLAEVEVRSGERDVGRAHLASLEHDASRKGFELIARKARAALESSGRGARAQLTTERRRD